MDVAERWRAALGPSSSAGSKDISKPLLQKMERSSGENEWGYRASLRAMCLVAGKMCPFLSLKAILLFRCSIAASVPSSAVVPSSSQNEQPLTEPLRRKRSQFSASLLSWKKQKISPLLGSSSVEEGQLVQALQKVDLGASQWASLPDHLIETILGLMKKGERNDWKHVQVRLQGLPRADILREQPVTNLLGNAFAAASPLETGHSTDTSLTPGNDQHTAQAVKGGMQLRIDSADCADDAAGPVPGVVGVPRLASCGQARVLRAALALRHAAVPPAAAVQHGARRAPHACMACTASIWTTLANCVVSCMQRVRILHCCVIMCIVWCWFEQE